MRSTKTILLLLALYLYGCSSDQPAYQYPHSDEQEPRTSQTFDHSDSKFSFIVHSDLTGGERPRIFEVAVEQMNLLRPEFIVNVGDLIDGGPADSTLWNEQWDWFDERANKAKAPLFYTGGNHDLTGNFAQGIWKERLGRPYYHFVYKNTLFLVLDSEDHGPDRHNEIEAIRNEGVRIYEEEGPVAYAKSTYAKLPERKWGNIGDAQLVYMKEAIRSNPEVEWIFLMLHKPVWDNPEDQNFKAIEEALKGKNYTVFHGHTHNFVYTQRKGMDYINLGTTGGSQNSTIGRSVDHFFWVTVDNNGVSIANLLMEGILNKYGEIPAGGDTLTFENKQP